RLAPSPLTSLLSLHDALPISAPDSLRAPARGPQAVGILRRLRCSYRDDLRDQWPAHQSIQNDSDMEPLSPPGLSKHRRQPVWQRSEEHTSELQSVKSRMPSSA